MRLTVAHDYFTQRGGAERVAAAVVEALGPVRVVTALRAPATTFGDRADPIETSFLQGISAFRRDPRRALVLLPLAWHLMPKVESGVVLCSSSGWSHRLRTAPGVRKVVYCHNPPRWLYQPREYAEGWRYPVPVLLGLLRPALIHGDRAAARTASVYIANSAGVAGRIRTAYGIEARVIHPPVTLDPDGEQERPRSVPPGGFFLTVGRGRGYKHTDRLIEAFRETPEVDLVVVAPVAEKDLPPNVHAVNGIRDAELRWLYAHARALVSVSTEDFGLTPLEANSLGTPALLLRAGGFLESTAEHVSGEFIDSVTVADIVRAVRAFPQEWDREAVRRHAAGFSLERFLAELNDCLLAEEDVPRLAGLERPVPLDRDPRLAQHLLADD